MIGDTYLIGYVKLYRKILSNPVFKSPELLQLFIYCLLRANHEEGKAFYGSDEIKISAGQFVTGRFELSKDLKQNESSTYKRLKRLEALHILALKSNNKNTLVTVVNWELYQSAEKESNNRRTPKEQQSNNKRTTKEQQSNTNKNVKNDKNERMKEDNIVSLEKIPYTEIQTLFNNICKSLSKVTRLTDSRNSKLRIRWKELQSLDRFKELFEKVEATPFLKGDNKNQWKATFDWLIENDRNYVKVLEGAYDKNAYDKSVDW